MPYIQIRTNKEITKENIETVKKFLALVFERPSFLFNQYYCL